MATSKKADKANKKGLLAYLIGVIVVVIVLGVVLIVLRNINDTSQSDKKALAALSTATPAPVDEITDTDEGDSTGTMAGGSLLTGDIAADEDTTDAGDTTDESDIVIPAVTAVPTPVAAIATALPTAEPVAVTEPDAGERTILISCAGDCTLGGDANSGTIARFEKYAAQYGYDYYFSNVADIFESDDFTIVNLEGTLTTSTTKRSGRKFNFKGDPANAQILTGVEVAVCANNHSYDFLEQGFADTQEAIEAEGIGFAGFDITYETEVNGITIGVIGVTSWQNKESEIIEMIETTKLSCDIVIVYIHWGEEYAYKPTQAQYTLACKMIDAGCDLVVGNHSHVIGTIHTYKGKYICYGLGNFCFGGNKNPDDKRCIIFQQQFVVSGDGTVSDGGINVIPCRVSSVTNMNDFCPTPVTGEKALEILQQVAKYSDVVNKDDTAFKGYNWLDSFIGYDLKYVTKADRATATQAPFTTTAPSAGSETADEGTTGTAETVTDTGTTP